jgi:hypothetical protein
MKKRIGRPFSLVTACNLVSMPPFVRPIIRPRRSLPPPFSTQGLKPCPSRTCLACAAGQWMRFDPLMISKKTIAGQRIGRVDHNRLRCGGFGRQSVHHSGEDAHVTPPLPTVVERLGWAIFLRRVTPPQTIAIYEYNSAKNAPPSHGLQANRCPLPGRRVYTPRRGQRDHPRAACHGSLERTDRAAIWSSFSQ